MILQALLPREDTPLDLSITITYGAIQNGGEAPFRETTRLIAGHLPREPQRGHGAFTPRRASFLNHSRAKAGRR